MQIVNILSQQVAFPILLGTATSTSTAASGPLNGQHLNKVRLSCGSYYAFWDGNVQNTGKEAASGVYIVLITVDGTPQGTKRIFNSK